MSSRRGSIRDPKGQPVHPGDMTSQGADRERHLPEGHWEPYSNGRACCVNASKAGPPRQDATIAHIGGAVPRLCLCPVETKKSRQRPRQKARHFAPARQSVGLDAHAANPRCAEAARCSVGPGVEERRRMGVSSRLASASLSRADLEEAPRRFPRTSDRFCPIAYVNGSIEVDRWRDNGGRSRLGMAARLEKLSHPTPSKQMLGARCEAMMVSCPARSSTNSSCGT